MKQTQQTTLGASVTLSGIGVHSGKVVTLSIRPAEANRGIAFLRTGLKSGHHRLIKAQLAGVTATELCTVLGESETGAVATIEHLMAAFMGLGIDNALVEIDGAEVPILDGSAAPFVEAFDRVGVVRTDAPRRYLKVLRTVRAEKGIAKAELAPYAKGLRLDVEIDFQNPVIGRQRRTADLSPTSFRRDLCRARTFGFIGDVERLWKAGFALGASLDNTVAVADTRILNPEGLRFADEFVRHKMLDAVGDLSLAGLPILGSYRSYCGGHRLNIAVLEVLFADRANYAIVDGRPRRDNPLADVTGGYAVPALH